MKRKYILAIPVLLVCYLSIIGCEKSEETTVKLNNAFVEEESFEANVGDHLLLEMVNHVRESGCDCKDEDGNVTKMPPVGKLIWSNDLARVAKDHYGLMETRKNINSKNLNGKGVGDGLIDVRSFWSVVAENFAMGPKTEKAVLDYWLNSTHDDCKNIMNPRVKEMGVGRSNDDTYSWTQLFGTKKWKKN